MPKVSGKEKSRGGYTLKNILFSFGTIVFFVAIILIYYNLLYEEKRDAIIKNGQMSAMQTADSVGDYLATSIEAVELTSFTMEKMIADGRSAEEITDYLVGQTTAVTSTVFENTTGMYGYIPNGGYVDGAGWVPEEGYEPTARPWYIAARNNGGKITLIDPYLDSQTNTIMMSLAKMLSDGISVVSMDISLAKIQEITENAVKAGQSDYEVILDSGNIVVAHSDRGEAGKDYGKETEGFWAKVMETVAGTENTYSELNYNGEIYLIYNMALDSGWRCLTIRNATSTFRPLLILLIVTIAVVIAMVIVLSYIMFNSMKRFSLSVKAFAESKAKSDFLSSMSHEIRTPINAVLGMNEMILRESGETNILAYSENIKASGNMLLGLINDILDFSKIESGKIEIVPVNYDLSSLVNDLAVMIKARAEAKNLKILFEINQQTPKKLHGDEVRIKQVITNILTNAVKYTKKGSVTLCIDYEDLAEEPGYMMLNVSVKDTGIGIKQEDMAKLFAEYERIEEKRNRNVEGTGLGMSITQRLLELMGSELKVESTYGVGSNFFFSLKQKVVAREPLGDFESAYQEMLKKHKQYKEKFRAPEAEVLVVDDNSMNILVFRNLLKQTQMKIDTADSGVNALALTMKKKYDIIFLDHMMPGKDGIETLQELKQEKMNLNLDTPVICLTANAISGVKEEYLEAGFDDYLCKPVDPGKLEEMLISYLPKEKIL